MEFLRSLFLRGVSAQGSDLIWPWLVNTFWMAAIAGLNVYLALLAALGTGAYGGPERIRSLVDAESRVKLCAAWCTYGVVAMLLSTAIWIYVKALLPTKPDLPSYLYPLSAHFTAILLLLLLGCAIYLSVRSDSKAAQSLRP